MASKSKQRRDQSTGPRFARPLGFWGGDKRILSAAELRDRLGLEPGELGE